VVNIDGKVIALIIFQMGQKRQKEGQIGQNNISGRASVSDEIYQGSLI